MVRITEEALKELSEKVMEMNECYVKLVGTLVFDDYVSLREACKTTGKTARQVRYLADSGKVRFKQESPKIRTYLYSDLKKYIEDEEEVKVG